MTRLYTITHKQSGQIVAMVEASTPAQAYARLCQEDYQISVTRAIDVGPHIRNGGRLITATTGHVGDVVTLDIDSQELVMPNAQPADGLTWQHR